MRKWIDGINYRNEPNTDVCPENTLQKSNSMSRVSVATDREANKNLQWTTPVPPCTGRCAVGYCNMLGGVSESRAECRLVAAFDLPVGVSRWF